MLPVGVMNTTNMNKCLKEHEPKQRNVYTLATSPIGILSFSKCIFPHEC
jgi:hypothetical protein